MVVKIAIGRRVPRNWFKRTAVKVRGLMTFQENIWLIIDRSLVMAKKQCAQTPNGGTFIKQSYRDMENVNYDIEWIEVEYQGNPDQEEEEYIEIQGLYKKLGDLFKGEIPKDENFSKVFKTERIDPLQMENAYKAGYADSNGESIAQKLLDIGIMIFIEKV
jgi:hypothetical protein